MKMYRKQNFKGRMAGENREPTGIFAKKKGSLVPKLRK